MNGDTKKILLIDLDDPRRRTRVQLLEHAGYAVDLRHDYVAAEELDDEGTYDLIVIAVLALPEKIIHYSNELKKANPDLPILLLVDQGVFIPRGTLSRFMEVGQPLRMMQAIASMLVGSTQIREVPAQARAIT